MPSFAREAKRPKNPLKFDGVESTNSQKRKFDFLRPRQAGDSSVATSLANDGGLFLRFLCFCILQKSKINAVIRKGGESRPKNPLKLVKSEFYKFRILLSALRTPQLRTLHLRDSDLLTWIDEVWVFYDFSVCLKDDLVFHRVAVDFFCDF